MYDVDSDLILQIRQNEKRTNELRVLRAYFLVFGCIWCPVNEHKCYGQWLETRWGKYCVRIHRTLLMIIMIIMIILTV